MRFDACDTLRPATMSAALRLIGCYGPEQSPQGSTLREAEAAAAALQRLVKV